MFAVGLSCMAFNMLRYVLSMPASGGFFFIINGCCILLKYEFLKETEALLCLFQRPV